MSIRPDNRHRAPLLLPALLLVYASVGVVIAMTARPNIDEGMFLGAGRLVAEGRLPYRDFPFAQAPLLPYAFAAAPTWLGSPLLGARAIALSAAVLGMAGALWLARHLAGGFAAVVTLLLTLATLPCLWVGSTVRAQAVATPLLVLGVAALARQRSGVLGWTLAPALLLVSTGIRLTNLPVFAVVFAWTGWRLRRDGACLARVVGAVAALALLIAGPALLAPSQARFQIITGQLTRGARLGNLRPPDVIGDLGRVLVAYLDLLPDAALLVTLALGLAAVVAWRVRNGWHPDLVEPLGDPDTAPVALAALGTLAFAPHLVLGNAFLEYLIPLWALLAPALGIALARELDRRNAGRRVRWTVALALLAYAAVDGARTRDVWIGAGEASFASFRRVSAELGQLAGPGCTMVTFETELAVEAGCRVLPGLEYSFFSYFAELPSAEAQRLGVANLALLRERVASARPELIVLAPAHAHLMLGPRLGAPPGRVRRRTPGSLDPLAFLGPLARYYELHSSPVIPSGVRRPGERDVAPLRVYVRRETW